MRIGKDFHGHSVTRAYANNLQVFLEMYHIVKKVWRNSAFEILAKKLWRIQGLPAYFSAR